MSGFDMIQHSDSHVASSFLPPCRRPRSLVGRRRAESASVCGELVGERGGSNVTSDAILCFPPLTCNADTYAFPCRHEALKAVRLVMERPAGVISAAPSREPAKTTKRKNQNADRSTEYGGVMREGEVREPPRPTAPQAPPCAPPPLFVHRFLACLGIPPR